MDITASVDDEALFGLVECDIHVPSEKKQFDVAVSRNDIREYMRDYAEKNKLLSSPSRTLIGSYKGKNILLATPLLNWYLDNGLKVTKIYQVIEYKPESCFEQFANTVSDAQREGDRDGPCAIKSDAMKLLRKVAYSKTLTNKAKHVNVVYVRGDNTRKLVNNPFKRLPDVAPNIF